MTEQHSHALDTFMPASVEQPPYIGQAQIVMERLGVPWNDVWGVSPEDQVIGVLLAAVLRLDARVKELEAR